MRLLSLISVALLMFASQSQLACAADAVPCSCLQELWVDYPGPYDLYFSLDHYTSCNDEGEEGLWYGYAFQLDVCPRFANTTIAKNTKDRINALPPYFPAMDRSWWE